MVIKFKIANEKQLYQIEGSNLTIIKVSIIIYFGTENAYHVFDKMDGTLLYCPEINAQNNLVKRSFKKYEAEYSSEIKECVASIKKI